MRLQGFRHPAQNRRADRRAKRSVEERSNKLEVEKHVWWLEAARAAHGQGPRVARGTTEEVRGRGYPAGLGSLQGTQPRPPDLEDARGARRLGLPPGRPPRPVTPRWRGLQPPSRAAPFADFNPLLLSRRAHVSRFSAALRLRCRSTRGRSLRSAPGPGPPRGTSFQ